MRHCLSVAVAGALACASAGSATGLPAQPAPEGSFEGTISYAATDRGGAHRVTYAISTGFMRLEVTGASEESILIVDAGAQILYVVLPARQIYLQMRMASAGRGAGSDARLERPVRTGRHGRVAGYRCQVWLLRDTGGETEICSTPGLGTVKMGENPYDPRLSGATWYGRLAAEGLFPLRVVTRDGDGREISRLEAIRVRRTRLDRSLFRPPPDFRQYRLPTLSGPSFR